MVIDPPLIPMYSYQIKEKLDRFSIVKVPLGRGCISRICEMVGHRPWGPFPGDASSHLIDHRPAFQSRHLMRDHCVTNSMDQRTSDKSFCCSTFEEFMMQSSFVLWHLSPIIMTGYGCGQSFSRNFYFDA